MSEFKVLSTPEQELAHFLTEVIGLPAADVSLVQQGAAVSVTTRQSPEEFILIMGDRAQAGLWHCVSSTGFRGFVTGSYSVLTLLIGEGPSWFWTAERCHIWRNRYAKARRVISAAAETVDPADVERGMWGEVARLAGENEISDQTLAVIEQLLLEES